ncbi:TonB-linked SusC/RagA family outer membrane protein [Lacibacter cauensis]|uniref:TonB-linked SusC/RagA family outer membrane protein n=1 Tax=Lacibacter cauensis TaxID=510947 RepID=A0A562SGC8_9BACT|nr:SusC/RagA family TonB-linked outer membrane protein [Lacibacter cauensis]TWI80322.1 TonB-linked SusC/RagA family outer membrane protein [Lacibacter cauensis]
MTRTPKRALLLFACAVSIGTIATAQKKNEKKDSSKPVAPPVQLIYTAVPKHLTATSTEALYSKDVLKSPVTSVKSTLTGRMAGLYTYQASGQPGADGASVSLRGQDPLVIIDGVVANLSIFNLEDVESVTLQKDALSTAMLGVRGSNGALLITTRKGKPQTQSISFTAQTSFQSSLGFPKVLGAYDYATLYNEASLNDGLPLRYTQADLDAYKNGTDPLGHPDVNWRNEVLKNSSRFDRYTLNASGGNGFARYYVSLEHVNQTGFFVTSDINKYNTNNQFKSYVIRSNVDINVTKSLSGGIYLLGRILSGAEPGSGTGNILSALVNTPNNAYPVYNPTGTFGGTNLFQNNILAQTIASGYRLNYKRDMLANFYLKQKLDGITPGLWAQVKTAFNATLSEDNNRSKSFAVFQAITTTTPVTYNQYGVNGTQANGNGIAYQGRSNYTEISVGYDRAFGKHGVNALVLANSDNTVNGGDLPYTVSGISGRAAYNFNEKYVAEAAFGYNGSNRYPPQGDFKRAFFPAAGLAWNVDKEQFLAQQKFISRLKVYGSFGKTGWDDPGYFSYYQRFFDASSVYFGTSAGTQTAITEQPLANPKIDFEKANKFNAGVDAAFLNNRLTFSVEYFNNKYFDLLQIRGRSSSIIGNSYPRENIGINRYTGSEFKLGWQEKTAKGFQFFALFNASVLRTKVIYMDEVFRPHYWMQRTGWAVGQTFGYVAEGLFQSQDEINRSATTVGYTPQPGDIKYKDLNKDGVIDQLDEKAIGRKYQPLIFFGLSLGAEYKGFDFSALIQGVTNRDVYVGGSSIWAFQNNGFGQAYENNLNRWTPATAATATYPRLNIGSNGNNHAQSSFWLRNGDYVRLKQIELGYSVPQKWLARIKLDNIRLFARGYNLFTIASKELDDRDPEVISAFSYPMQRLINFGLNIKL